MLNQFEISGGSAIYGKDEFTYQRVIDDFPNAKFIGIITFNISSKGNALLDKLKNACKNGAEAVIITNIPKRFLNYYYYKNAIDAKNMIDLYIDQLNPEEYEMRLSPYFNFINHAKVIMTNNIIYYGSSNFSDESNSNFECGTISTDKELINFFKENVFMELQNESISYYKHDFAIAIANLENLIQTCQESYDLLFEAAYEPWADYGTNFEEEWVYRTTESGITLDLLNYFIKTFSKFDSALSIIDDIIYECEDDDKEKMLENILDDYRETYNDLYNNIFDMYNNLEELAKFNVEHEASNLISNEYGMLAYDEMLDHYVSIALQETTDKYASIIKRAKPIVCHALNEIEKIIIHFDQLKQCLYKLLEINKEIDNTNI